MRRRRMTHRIGLLAAVAAAALLGCGPGADTIRIGAKPFAEQQILAQMLARLVAETEFDAEVSPCDNSYACQRALREGELDLMVEYSGTALQFVGGPEPDRSNPIAQVRRLFRPLGLRWLEPLGFDNSYRILVPVGRGAALGLESIDDLDRISGGVRVACPSEFLRRSRDGLAPLMRRYGFTLEGEPLIINDPGERFEALIQGRADVAVGYSTDGAITGLGLVALDDPLSFFPPYEAAVVVREQTWSQHPELREPLSSLAGELPTKVMRSLNYAVQVEGQSPEVVAGRFLEEKELIDSGQGEGRRRSAKLKLATGGQPDLDRETAQAIRALRKVFPDRPLERVATPDVVEAVSSGRARFGVASAERFFPESNELETRVEAVAVLGTHYLHLIRRADDVEGAPFRGTVGTLRPGTAGGRIGVAVLGTAGSRIALREDAETLIERVAANELDAALIPTEAGDAQIVRAVGSGALALVPLADWLTPERAVRLPYLHRVRLPTDPYPQPVDTLGVQVLLVGPGRRPQGSSGAGGPAAALPTTALPVSLVQAEQLAEAKGIHEIPDPSLPSAWTTMGAGEDQTMGSSGVLESAISLFCVVFLAWLVVLVKRKPQD